MNNDLMRLNKRMTELGICSRREADDYISKGLIMVNGKVAILGQKVTTQDEITLHHALKKKQNQKITVILHKPIGFVSSQPEKNYHSAQSLITPDNYWQTKPSFQQINPAKLKGLAAAGRLDIDSTGLLVLTQDGLIARKIIGHNSQVEKEYLVEVMGTLTKEGLALLNHGLSLDDKPLLPAKVSCQRNNLLKFILIQGKKRQIRRMCELVGLKVVKLKRIRIGCVKLGTLPVGKWRFLDKDEVF